MKEREIVDSIVSPLKHTGCPILNNPAQYLEI